MNAAEMLEGQCGYHKDYKAIDMPLHNCFSCLAIYLQKNGDNGIQEITAYIKKLRDEIYLLRRKHND